ncbi:hypothetical protein A2Z23_01325 [Candidatus Curtissbacteria bacterium RBG_16_39_7]|uniref:Uncharacterized protein n=1 Tax=Candidatus Curtissbacteria bacterium RBG_16_39_7 TaxID=1797707 RepID=A0A1F5G2K6_9BACT|nr:MAG: hypothetical protein A2Z23_01325 [Candidatus Curtissbacteria bacterium RBG_16_39_7]
MKLTLTEVASFLKRRWILAAVVFLAVVSLGLLFQLVSDPEKPSKKVSLFEKLEIKAFPTLSKLPPTVDVSSLKTEEAPKKLAVFNLEKEPLFEEDAILLAKKFGITEKPKSITDVKLGKIFYFFQKPFSLSVQKDQLVFGKSIKPTGELLALEQAVKIAQDFINNKGLEGNLDLDPEDVEYFGSGSPKPLLSSDKNVDIIQISFVKKTENLPVFGQNPKESLFYVRIARGGEVVGLKYTFLPKMSVLKDYPIINSQEATAAIFKGKAVLTYLLAKDDEGMEGFPNYKVTFINLTSAKLAYLFQLENQTLQPIYVFWGQAKMDGTKSGDITFYLPALRGE